MSSPRQTQSYLKNLFAEHRIFPRHHLGQNFLIDLNIHDLLVHSASLNETDVVLEVGAGTGALTGKLAASGATVCAIEVDERLASLTARSTSEYSNVEVIQADILAGKNKLSPQVESVLRAKFVADTSAALKLVANLPYSIAAPLIANLLIHPQLRLALGVVTIQREVAERIQAKPATSAYGALSVLVQAIADVDLVRVLPPTVFWPRPKVDSAIIRIQPVQTKLGSISNVSWFRTVVHQVFLHRRKNLRNVLSLSWGDCLNKDDAEALLTGIGLAPSIRGEALSVEEFIMLAETLGAHINAKSSE